MTQLQFIARTDDHDEAALVDRAPLARPAAILLALAILILAAAPYYPLFRSPFLSDDRFGLLSNPLLRTWTGVISLCVHPCSLPAYQPLTWAALRFEYAVSLTHPSGFRAAGLFIHALNAVLFWYTLRRLEIPGTWLAAAVFALHPMHTQSLATIGNQGTLLASFFLLTSTIAFLRLWQIDQPDEHGNRPEALEHPGHVYILGLALFVCGLLSGVAAAMLPLVLLAVLWRVRRSGVRGSGFRGRELAPLLVLAVAAIAMNIWTAIAAPSNQGIARPSTAWMVRDQSIALVWPRLVWPSADAWFYVPCMLLIALLAIGVGARLQRGRAIGAISASSVRWTAGVAVIVLLGTLSWRAAGIYADEPTLWSHIIERDPANTLARSRFGALLLEQGRPQLAAAQYRQILALNPADVKAMLNLGQALEQMSTWDEAAELYGRAVRVQENNAVVHLGLAAAAARKGNKDEAIAHYWRAAELDPDNASTHNDLAVLLAASDRLGEAVEQYRAALRLNPRFVKAMVNLSTVLFKQGQFEESADLLQQAVKIDPACFEAYFNSGSMLYTLKQWAQAERMFRAAVAIKPDSAEAYNCLGIVLAAQGRMGEAIFSFGRAVDLDPTFEQAKRNLAAARKEDP